MTGIKFIGVAIYLLVFNVFLLVSREPRTIYEGCLLYGFCIISTVWYIIGLFKND